MASKQANANEAITKAVTESTRIVIQAMAAAATERSQSVGPKIGRSVMKEPRFNWEGHDKYNEHKNFRLEVNNMFVSYNTPHTEQLTIVKCWLGRKGLQFMLSLTHMKKRKMEHNRRVIPKCSTTTSNINLMRQ